MALTRRFWGLTLLALVMLAGCESTGNATDEPDASGAYVGRVEGTQARVAVLLGTLEAVAYVCNGEEQISSWFTGPVQTPGEVSLAREDGETITAVLANGLVSGVWSRADGSVHRYTAAPPAADAGLYRAMNDGLDASGTTVGWIVDNAGVEVGARRRQQRVEPAPALAPEVTIDGARAQVFRFLLPQPPAPGIPIPYPNTSRVSR